MLTGEIHLDLDRRYSIAETCKILQCDRKTLRKYTRSGDIKMGLHKPSGKMFYEGYEIDKFFNSTI